MSEQTRDNGLHLPVALGVALLVLMFFLLYMAGKTGQREFDQAQSRLDAVQIYNLRLDAALFPLLFEVQITYDELTDLQAELRAATQRYARHVRSEQGDELVELVEQKNALIDDFKTEQSVQRNSRAIAEQMLVTLQDRLLSPGSDAMQRVMAVERALLEYLTQRDEPATQRLVQVLQEAREDLVELAGVTEWEVLYAHGMTLATSSARLMDTLQQVWLVPLPQALRDNTEQLAGELAQAASAATGYRRALFGVAVLLLAFSAWKAVEVRRYMAMLRATNESLEARVERRTRAIERANAALRDEITQRQEVELQLRLAQKLEAIGQLAAGIAHEINTPAQYVSDNVSFFTSAWQDLDPLLEDYRALRAGGSVDSEKAALLWEQADVDYLRDEMPAALEQARAGLRQIADIVLAIKSFSHPGSGARQALDLNKAVENVVLVARNEWKYVAELTLDLDPGMSPVICDASSVNQAILNLIVNAAQAISEARDRGDHVDRSDHGGFGHIVVSSRREGGFAVICVQDDGPGVPEEIRDRVFDPFFTTKEVGKGTGQGLTIAHRVATEHEGWLRLDSTAEERGARFCLALPLSSAAVAEEVDDVRHASATA